MYAIMKSCSPIVLLVLIFVSSLYTVLSMRPTPHAITCCCLLFTLFLREDDVTALAGAVAYRVHRTLTVCLCVCVCVCVSVRSAYNSGLARARGKRFLEHNPLVLSVRMFFSIFKSEHGKAFQQGKCPFSSAMFNRLWKSQITTHAAQTNEFVKLHLY